MPGICRQGETQMMDHRAHTRTHRHIHATALIENFLIPEKCITHIPRRQQNVVPTAQTHPHTGTQTLDSSRVTTTHGQTERQRDRERHTGA